jgi:hypothetical protein
MQLSRLTAAAAALVFIAACGETPTESGTLADDLQPQMDEVAGPPLHIVSAGGADLCEVIGQPTGCSANYSLVAIESADGSVTGQYTDALGGNGGQKGLIHVAVDCLIVQGNAAIVGGVVTHATGDGAGYAGIRAITKVWDNGTSTGDPPDQISFTFPTNNTCADLAGAAFPAYDLVNGQVTVR